MSLQDTAGLVPLEVTRFWAQSKSCYFSAQNFEISDNLTPALLKLINSLNKSLTP